ncbi:peptidylprolyl isomerase [Paucibacter sp. O1-1]|uniref:peptidylprolyl isomerase n=1 Tax=unclassified Roseateles TaxID=2626991 RepID=UPI0010F89B8F|nr:MULTISPECIES: peptidylprolyl isomerase [unclassified Roseateles]MCU7371745.1 peptidylprolyl isomerase [Paucibacter sp. O1-1]MCZ7881041.1 peptidylprolyl isomerase [Paucibacter sp. M5-1]MDA3826735.1 peptidylprolyl isomerase [Paucibacter sp. O1-1]MDC6166354.1 peptidylprolyl isomerase [Paucibacter sp. XJ19-41]
MKKFVLAATVAALSAALVPVTASAQNVATVNGKPVPKARVDLLINQVTKSGQQQRTPELEAQVKDEVVLREIFIQEAEKRGIPASADYKAQMELARQSILIRELFADFGKKNGVTDAEAKAEYDKFKAQNSGTEYRARHILVEKEEDAKALIAQIKGGAKFEELASKNSKDPGSAANGGDLDFANPGSYVPEFSQALTALKKGEMTQEPVKSQFGFHIIKLEDTREAQFPAFDDVKPQIVQRLSQQKIANFQQELKTKAKTDYKFAN